MQRTLPTDGAPAAAAPFRLPRPLVLVGLMGAGKSTIGRRTAQVLDVPFVDADAEIETAAGCTIEEIFERHGEAAFREGERRVIGRLLNERGPHVLATGGGAFMDPETRRLILDHAVSVWLKADIDVLLKRVRKRHNRPLLKNGDPRVILERLMRQREPAYAQADVTVESREGPHEQVVDLVIDAVGRYLAGPVPDGVTV